MSGMHDVPLYIFSVQRAKQTLFRLRNPLSPTRPLISVPEFERTLPVQDYGNLASEPYCSLEYCDFSEQIENLFNCLHK